MTTWNDVSQINLEAYYLGNYPPDKVVLSCESVSLFPAKVKETEGADGTIMRSIIEPAFLLCSEIDDAIIRNTNWTPTIVWFSSENERHEYQVHRIDLLPHGQLKISLHS